MSWFTRAIRYLLLVKEIVSKQGEVHFRRYRLLQTPWFAIYIHQILKSDTDIFLHDHPWGYSSVILEGSYQEDSAYPPNFDVHHINTYYSGDVIQHKAEDAHKLTLKSTEVWTLVFTSGRERVWGYQTSSGWIDYITYRQMKNEGKLR
jgi:hypothetical protein